MGDVDIDDGGDVPDGEDGGGMFSWYHCFVRLLTLLLDVPMAPMDMDDEGDGVSEGEE